ncbi:MAG: hypothetical protein HZA08_01365 [Nitrospirae bacterium]|nr:hypothetical protein [Nitrospirota bacterium]
MSYGYFRVKHKIIHISILFSISILTLFSTSCNYQSKEKNVDSIKNLHKQTEGTYPLNKEEIKQDTNVDYEKPAPPLTPEERQRLIDSTEKEDKDDKK